jgi:hypothetical protein
VGGNEKLGSHSQWGKGKEEWVPSINYLLSAHMFVSKVAGGVSVIPKPLLLITPAPFGVAVGEPFSTVAE